MKKELLKNKITINYVDDENKFFSVSKNNICGTISFNDFYSDLNMFLDTVELYGSTCNYDVDYIESNAIDFSKIEENQIRDLMLDGLKIDFLLTLNSFELDNLYAKYN